MHAHDCNIAETHDLTVGCPECEAKTLAECDSQVLVNVCGMTRRELEDVFGSGGPYDTFWDAVIRANAMNVRARHRYLARRKAEVR